MRGHHVEGRIEVELGLRRCTHRTDRQAEAPPRELRRREGSPGVVHMRKESRTDAAAVVESNRDKDSSNRVDRSFELVALLGLVRPNR